MTGTDSGHVSCFGIYAKNLSTPAHTLVQLLTMPNEEELVLTADDGLHLMTEQQLADALQMHPQSLADWRHRSSGPRYVKLGRCVRYRIADVEEWLESRAVGELP